MFLFSVWLTIAVALLALLIGYGKSRDVFHPLVLTMPMFVFIYGYMPVMQDASGELYSYITTEQASFAQWLALGVLLAFTAGCFQGTRASIRLEGPPADPDPRVLYRGAMFLGGTGLLAWLFMLKAGGGLSGLYGSAYGGAWSDIGYIRDSVYLLLVAILILLSPQLFAPRRVLWWVAIILFAFPWAAQGLLGARRGPTFVLAVGVGVSCYLARNKRPSLALTATAGAAVGLLMLFLVANRGSIYLGSEKELTTEQIGETLDAAPSNEYIFGAGCIAASRQSGDYFWGKRILAQLVVRPIPRQLWPNKYADFGVPELEQNAGVAGGGLQAVLGWTEVPGAAAAMVADLWVEFSWGCIAFAAFWGWAYGYCWKRAVVSGGGWTVQYVIMLILSVYLITQGLEAVTFRLIILSVPVWWLWRRATIVRSPRGTPAPAFAG